MADGDGHGSIAAMAGLRGFCMTVSMVCRSAAAAVIAAGLGFALPGSGRAGEIADRAAEAEALLAAGDVAAAQAAFDKAAAAFWIAAPLQFRIIAFADTIDGFGKYTPRGEAVFRAYDTLRVYMEPLGYGFAAAGGDFAVKLAADIEIRSPGGLVFAKAEGFGPFEWDARSRTREIHLALDVPLPRLRPGDYELLVTLRDQGSAKTASATLPFAIR